MGTPFFNQIISGLGFPLAAQSKVTELEGSATTTTLRGLAMNTGGCGLVAATKQTTQSHVAFPHKTKCLCIYNELDSKRTAFLGRRLFFCHQNLPKI